MKNLYKDIRAYHIAIGMKVRWALIKFAKEIEEVCQQYVLDFYGEHSPEYYERSGQLLSKMRIGELIKTEIKGAFEKERASFLIDVFDWDALDSYDNGYGNFGTYSDFSGNDSREDVEDYFQEGIYGHSDFNIRNVVKSYIDSHLDDVITSAIKSI